MFTSLMHAAINGNKSLLKSHKALQWYFYNSESEMGWKSNFSSMVRAWIFSKKHENEDIEDQLISIIDSQSQRQNILYATNKERKIFSAFTKCNYSQQRILADYFEERRTNINVNFLFDYKLYISITKDKKEIQLDGLVPGIRLLFQTPTASNLPNLSLNYLKLASKKNIPIFNKIREEADQLYMDALSAFSKNYK